MDAGNGLVRRRMRSPEPDEKEQARHLARAKLILDFYKHVGIDVMGIGDEDLLLGVKELKKLSSQTGVKLLSANLDRAGSKPFGESVVVKRGGKKIGVFSVVLPSRYTEKQLEKSKLEFKDPIEVAKKVAGKLEKKGADIIVVLTATDKKKAREILSKAPQIDLAIASGRRAWIRRPLKVGDSYVVGVPPGGKHVGVTELHIKDGSMKLADVSARYAIRNRIDRMLSSCARYEKMRKRAKSGRRDRYVRRLESMQRSILKSIDKLKQEAKTAPKGSFISHRAVLLDKKVGDDEKIKKLVVEAKKKHDLDNPRNRKRRRFRGRRNVNLRRLRGKRRRGRKPIVKQGSKAMSLPPGAR